MNGNIPVLFIHSNSLAEAWEDSLINLYNCGCDIKTEYDNPNDPPSKDCTMIMVVENPLIEPMIHRCLPGSLEDLQEYTMEVCDGIKDHLIDRNSDTKWKYTYHSRLFNYDFDKNYYLNEKCLGYNSKRLIINQIEQIAKTLSKTPYSRRAQAITWKVWEDNTSIDPPCLQRIFCRILPNENNEWILNMNVSLRSNDAYRAAFMNMYAFVRLQEKIANRISELADRKVIVGRYMHQADSYHIYGSNIKDFEYRFLKAYKTRKFHEMYYHYEDVKEIMDEAIPEILKKVKRMK
jgi:thymidylate synthase